MTQTKGNGAENLQAIERFGRNVLEIMVIPFFLGIAILSIGLLIHWIWMLIDCATNEPSDGNDKIIWILVIIFAGIIGSLIYQFARRPTRLAQYGK